MKFRTDADAFEAAKTQRMGTQTLRRWPLLYTLDVKGCKYIYGQEAQNRTKFLCRARVAFSDPSVPWVMGWDSLHLF